MGRFANVRYTKHLILFIMTCDCVLLWFILLFHPCSRRDNQYIVLKINQSHDNDVLPIEMHKEKTYKCYENVK